MSKYQEWIKKNYPDEHSAYGKCEEATIKMQKEFPELQRVRGFYHCPMWGQRTHWWLKNSDGRIIDPTGHQHPSFFLGIGDYQELSDNELPIGKCVNCGAYTFKTSFSDYICSEDCFSQYKSYINSCF